MGWRDRAACLGMPTELWDNTGGSTGLAIRVCARCPVRRACFDDAIRTQSWGWVRGGVAMTRKSAAEPFPELVRCANPGCPAVFVAYLSKKFCSERCQSHSKREFGRAA